MRSKNFKDLQGWELPELMEFLAVIRPTLREVGFELGLTGSVLFDGKSTNDGDVIIYPRDASSFNLLDLYKALERLGMNQEFSHSEILKLWKMKNSNDVKHVEAWSYKGKRLDLFILR